MHVYRVRLPTHSMHARSRTMWTLKDPQLKLVLAARHHVGIRVVEHHVGISSPTSPGLSCEPQTFRFSKRSRIAQEGVVFIQLLIPRSISFFHARPTWICNARLCLWSSVNPLFSIACILQEGHTVQRGVRSDDVQLWHARAVPKILIVRV